MSMVQIKSFASAIIVVVLLLAACSKNADSKAVAEQFVRLYFVEDNLAAAVKLASGSAREKLEGLLREIEAAGAQEPPGDKPTVQVTLQETQPVSEDEMLYIYRVTSDVELQGMEPITARLWLSKDGNAWRVSRFVQKE